MTLRKLTVLAIVLLFSPALFGFSFFGSNHVKSITPRELNKLMQTKDIFLVDVHIPGQRHIKGTDLMVPFNQIKWNIDKFPKDRSVPIYLYCMGGPMGYQAAMTLAELGYQNVYNLQGGMMAWQNAGFN